MTLDSKTDKPQIMIVDDEIVITRALDKLLQNQYVVKTAANCKDGISLLENSKPHLLLIDWVLPDQSGLEILKVAAILHPNAVRILLSGKIDLIELTEAVNQGLVHRVVLKPWDNDNLLLVIREALSFQKILVERNRFEKLSLLDPVTGVFNRRAIEQRVYEEVARSQRHQRPISFLMIDVDRFKKTNDLEGHLKGDFILKSLAEILQQSFRNIDIVGRYGGDEFFVVLPDTKLDSAKEVADRVRQSVIDRLSVTVSIGIAAFPDHADQSLTLIQQADEALLTAKKRGRNQTVIARPLNSR